MQWNLSRFRRILSTGILRKISWIKAEQNNEIRNEGLKKKKRLKKAAKSSRFGRKKISMQQQRVAAKVRASGCNKAEV